MYSFVCSHKSIDTLQYTCGHESFTLSTPVLCRDAIPPSLETSEISSGCGIISKPDLLVYSVFKTTDEWCDGNCIHRHGKWVSLGGAFLGEKDFSVNEQLNIFSIGVSEDLGESRTELMDIPKGRLSIQRIECI